MNSKRNKPARQASDEEKRKRDEYLAWRDASRARELAEDLWRHSNAPKIHAERTLATEGPSAAAWNLKLEALTAKLGTGCTLAFVGDRGPGKTQMSVELIRRSCRAGRSARYATAMEFFLAVRDGFRKDGPSQVEVLSRYETPALLVLDEMQVRGDTRWEDQLLTHLIDTRYRARRDTILIANLTHEAFDAAVGPNITGRIIESGGVLSFDWPSFRGRGK